MPVFEMIREWALVGAAIITNLRYFPPSVDVGYVILPLYVDHTQLPSSRDRSLPIVYPSFIHRPSNTLPA